MGAERDVTTKECEKWFLYLFWYSQIHTSAKRTEECHFSTHENESGDVAFTHTCHGQKHDLFVDAQGTTERNDTIADELMSFLCDRSSQSGTSQTRRTHEQSFLYSGEGNWQAVNQPNNNKEWEGRETAIFCTKKN